MGKRELKALQKEQKARFDARVAVYRALWEDPRYVRMASHADRLNHAVTLERDLVDARKRGAPLGPDMGTAESLRAAEHRYSRYHRRIQAVERAALAKAGFPNG